MEDDVVEKWGVDREKGKLIYQSVFDDLMGALIKEIADHERHGDDYLVDVAIAGLGYARALTQTDSFSLARSSKADSARFEAVMQYAHRREKETPATPAPRSEPIDLRRLRALLNASSKPPPGPRR